MYGGPSHVDLLDPKPELAKWHGKAIPVWKPEDAFMGEEDEERGDAELLPLCEARAGRDRHGGDVSQSRAACGRPLRDPQHARGEQQSRPRDLPDEHGLHPARQAVHGLVGDVWPRLRERESARVCRAAGSSGRAGEWRAQLVERLHARLVSRRALPQQRRADRVSDAAEKCVAKPATGAARSAEAMEHRIRRRESGGDTARRPHQHLRAGLSACR
jgi:hypothetical protein